MQNKRTTSKSIYYDAKPTNASTIVYNPSETPLLSWKEPNDSWFYGPFRINRNGAFYCYTQAEWKGTSFTLAYPMPMDDESERFNRFKKACRKVLNPDPFGERQLKGKVIDEYDEWMAIFTPTSLNLKREVDNVPHVEIVACSLNAFEAYHETGVPVKDFNVLHTFVSQPHRNPNTPRSLVYILSNKKKMESIKLVFQGKFPNNRLFQMTDVDRKIDDVMMTTRTEMLIQWMFKNCDGSLRINAPDTIFADGSDEFCFLSELGPMD